MNTAYIQWCNENEGRHYPLAEHATLVDNNGLVLPNDIIADLSITVAPAYRDAYVSSVWVTPQLLGVSIAHANMALASVLINRSTYTPYTAIPLQAMPALESFSGWIVFGNYKYTARQRWLFSSTAQSGIEMRAIKLIDDLPVVSIRKLGASDIVAASKVVKLVGAGYLRVYKHETDPQAIVVDLNADSRALFLGPCFTLAEQGDCGTPPLRSINGVCPNDDGIITLVLS